jgi:hypothetical protein
MMLGGLGAGRGPLDNVPEPFKIVLAICGCCLYLAVLGALVWAGWVMWDSYDRGAGVPDGSLAPCGSKDLIWWFMFSAFAYSMAVPCCSMYGAICCCPMYVFYIMIIGAVTILSLNVYLAISGTWIWQHMSPTCAEGYEEDFPDLLFIFHVYIILLYIGLACVTLWIIVFAAVTYGGFISRLPPSHPVRSFFEPVVGGFRLSSYEPIVSNSGSGGESGEGGGAHRDRDA